MAQTWWPSSVKRALDGLSFTTETQPQTQRLAAQEAQANLQSAGWQPMPEMQAAPAPSAPPSALPEIELPSLEEVTAKWREQPAAQQPPPTPSGTPAAMPQAPGLVPATITQGPKPGQTLQPGESVGNVTLAGGSNPQKQAEVYQEARAAGLDDEAARILVAVTETEGGLTGAIGDEGQSRGPFQFHEGGQMPGFRAWVRQQGIQGDPDQLVHDHRLATRYAATTYLGRAIAAGRAQGLSGADLATYVQANGQVSVDPWKTGQNYQRLYGGGQPQQSPPPPAQPAAPPAQVTQAQPAQQRAADGFTWSTDNPNSAQYARPGAQKFRVRDPYGNEYELTQEQIDKTPGGARNLTIIGPVAMNAGAAAGSPQPAPAAASAPSSGVTPTPDGGLWSPDSPAGPQGAYQAATGRSGGPGVLLRGPLSSAPAEVGNDEYIDPDHGPREAIPGSVGASPVQTYGPPLSEAGTEMPTSYNDPDAGGTISTPIPYTESSSAGSASHVRAGSDGPPGDVIQPPALPLTGASAPVTPDYQIADGRYEPPTPQGQWEPIANLTQPQPVQSADPGGTQWLAEDSQSTPIQPVQTAEQLVRERRIPLPAAAQEPPAPPVEPFRPRGMPEQQERPSFDPLAELEQYGEPGRKLAAELRRAYYNPNQPINAWTVYEALQAIPFEVVSRARRELIPDRQARLASGTDPAAPFRPAAEAIGLPLPSPEELNPEGRPASDIAITGALTAVAPDPLDPAANAVLGTAGRAIGAGVRATGAAGRAIGQAVQPVAEDARRLWREGSETAARLNAEPGSVTAAGLGAVPERPMSPAAPRSIADTVEAVRERRTPQQQQMLEQAQASATEKLARQAEIKAAMRGQPTNEVNRAIRDAGATLTKTEEAARIGFTGQEEVADVLREGQVIPSRVVAGMLGQFPSYLEGVTDFIVEQRQKLVSGTLTPRDVSKAYIHTVGSMQAGAQGRATLEGKLGRPVRDLMVDQGKVRPEEAIADWFFTPEGQRALDAIESGNVDQAAWNALLEMRDAYGNNTLRNMGVFGPKSRATGEIDFTAPIRRARDGSPLEYDIRNIVELTQRLNAARGDTVAIMQEIAKVKGIGAAKPGFIKHLLGLGNEATFDAVEMNLWLTGKGDTGKLAGPAADMARAAKLYSDNPEVTRLLFDQIRSRFDELRAAGVGAEIDPAVFNHVMHHWIWDAAKGLQTTHAGMYDAMRNAATLGAFPDWMRGTGTLNTVNRVLSEAIAGGTGGAVIEQARNPDEDPRTAAARGFVVGAAGFPIATRAIRGVAGRQGTRVTASTLGSLPDDAARVADAGPTPRSRMNMDDIATRAAEVLGVKPEQVRAWQAETLNEPAYARSVRGSAMQQAANMDEDAAMRAIERLEAAQSAVRSVDDVTRMSDIERLEIADAALEAAEATRAFQGSKAASTAEGRATARALAQRRQQIVARQGVVSAERAKQVGQDAAFAANAARRAAQNGRLTPKDEQLLRTIQDKLREAERHGLLDDGVGGKLDAMETQRAAGSTPKVPAWGHLVTEAAERRGIDPVAEEAAAAFDAAGPGWGTVAAREIGSQLGAGTVGAAVGATMDEEDPRRGAALGFAAGAGSGFAARRLAARFPTSGGTFGTLGMSPNTGGTAADRLSARASARDARAAEVKAVREMADEARTWMQRAREMPNQPELQDEVAARLDAMAQHSERGAKEAERLSQVFDSQQSEDAFRFTSNVERRNADAATTTARQEARQLEQARIRGVVAQIDEVLANPQASGGIERLQNLYADLTEISQQGFTRSSEIRMRLQRNGLLRAGLASRTEDVDGLVQALARVDPNKPEEMRAILQIISKPRLIDKILEYQYVNMLSSPITQGVNILSNVAQLSGRLLLQNPLEYAYSGGKSTGAGAAIRGAGRGFREALGEAGQIMRTGISSKSMERAAELGDYGHVNREALTEQFGLAGAALHFMSTRPLQAMDALLGNMAYASAAEQYAQRTADRLLKSGSEAVKGMSREQARAHVMSNIWDYPEVIEKAGKISDYTLLKSNDAKGLGYGNRAEATFRRVAGLGRPSENDGFIGQSAAFLFNQVLPFTNVPLNFAKQGAERTVGAPVNAIRAIGAFRRGETERGAELAAKATIGAGAMTAGIAFAWGDNLTGDGPSDAGQRAVWEQTHKRNSFRFGPNSPWISWEGTPWAIPFGMIAGAKENAGEAITRAAKKGQSDQTDLGLSVAGGVARGAWQGFSSQSFIKSLGQQYELMTGNQTGLGAVAASGAGTVSRFIPAGSMLNFLARVGDTVERDAGKPQSSSEVPQNVLDRLSTRVPGARQTIDSRLDIYGEDMPNEQAGLGAFPYYRGYGARAGDPITQRVEAAGVGAITVPDEVPAGGTEGVPIPLTNDEKRAFQQAAGQAWRRQLENSGIAAEKLTPAAIERFRSNARGAGVAAALQAMSAEERRRRVQAAVKRKAG